MPKKENVDTRLTWKAKLSDKFHYSGLAQLLIFSIWFRIAFVLMICFFVFMGLFLPKIWKTTPEGFTPIIKVSGLDKVQAWSLERTARKATEAGDHQRALYAWRVALGNNQGDADNIRGFLDYLAEFGAPRETIGLAYYESNFLLDLANTNRNDVSLVARVYDHYEILDQVKTLLEPVESELTPDEQPIYLKSLFSTGDYTRFNEQWETAAEEVKADTEMQLYRDAYLAGWGPADQSADAYQRLKTADSAGEFRELKGRLELDVTRSRGDLPHYKTVLDRLVSQGIDHPSFHATYWLMLDNEGRRAEAVELAKNYPFPPNSAGNLVQYSDILLHLGLKEESMELLSRHIPQYGYSEALWLKQANILAIEERWEELKELAVEIRIDLRVSDSLDAFTYYLEGLADYKQARYRPAEDAFHKMLGRPFENPYLALHVAINLEKLGYHGIAKDLLVPLEDPLIDHAAYWQALNSAGINLKSDDLVFKTAEKLFQMHPDNWVTQFNYAASLLSQRQNPSESISITVKLLNQMPDNLGIKINHALALLQNGRTTDAQALLMKINVNDLVDSYASSYNLALFEVYLNNHDNELAVATAEKIDPEYLFQSEISWYQSKLREVEQQVL